MSPSFPRQNQTDGTAGDAKPFCNGALGHRGRKNLYLSHIGFGQLRHSVSSPARMRVCRLTWLRGREAKKLLSRAMPISARHSALAHGILHILPMCSGEQMVRAHTPRIVAAMANKQTFRDWPDCKLVGIAMGVNLHAMPQSEKSIAPCIDIGRPVPTRRRLINLRPEPGHGISFRSVLGSARARAKAALSMKQRIGSCHKRLVAVGADARTVRMRHFISSGLRCHQFNLSEVT